MKGGMGILMKPVTEKNPEDNENELARWGLCSMQGHRRSQEDAHLTVEVKQEDGNLGMLFCVFDGHGGNQVSKFAAKNFNDMYVGTKEFKEGQYGEALKEAFNLIDAEVKKEEYSKDAGSTVCVVYMNKEKIWCASAGDARAVLCRDKNTVVAMSEDHKPQDEKELERIEEADHWICEWTNRVRGELAVSRSFGYHKYKDNTSKTWDEQAVTACPDVREFTREGNESYFILACDGIWDCLDNQKAVDRVNEEEAKLGGEPISMAIGNLLQSLLPKVMEGKVLGTDNMTCMVVHFKN